MKLEKIKDWKEIEKFLDKNISEHDEKNCEGSNINHSCNHCNEYFELMNYQQDLAATKYENDSPVNKWDNSFRDTLNYMEGKYLK